MDERARAEDAPVDERDVEVKNAAPKAVAGDWEPPAPGTGPAPIPPGHILVGGDSPLGNNPVTGSVVDEDWGRVPGAEPDVESTAVQILEEDTVI